VLSARTARAVGFDLDVLFVDLDRDLVVELGRYIHGRERGVAPALRVEGRNAHEPMHANLGAHIAVGEGAANGDDGRLDAAFVAALQLEDFDREPAPLAPAHVHAQQHFRPIARLGTAGARVDGDDGVLVVVFARHHQLELELAQTLLDRFDFAGDLGDVVVALGHFAQFLRVGAVRLE